MKKIVTAFDWEDEFEILENITADVYVNDKLKIEQVVFNKIQISRNNANKLKIKLCTEQPILNALISQIKKIYDLKIELKFIKPYYSIYNSIVMYGAMSNSENRSFVKNHVESLLECKKIDYNSNKDAEILKEWYGSCNKLNFYNGFFSSKKYEEIITYKNKKTISFRMTNKAQSSNSNCFWVNIKDFKFKVSINDVKEKEDTYNRYVIEYRKSWGLIPDENIRNDISRFLSFIIGTKLIKFGETYFDNSYITKKQYLAQSPLDTSMLYQTNLEFYNTDYRRNDTDFVIKQIPKMLNKYFKLKEEYRLNEVLASLYVHSYLNFNFINYVTYIEMFSNINQKEEKLKTVIPAERFKLTLKKLNAVKGIPKKIQEKFHNLNNIGIGKKVEKLLKKYKIDYNRYKDVFSTRGKVVHGDYVDIEEMHIASQKAKELLTILTLKKLGYNGYIRNFTNNEIV